MKSSSKITIAIVAMLVVFIGGLGSLKLFAEDESTSDDYIKRDKIEEIVFMHAGVEKNKVQNFEIDLEDEYGTLVYKVDFESEGYDYDYSIDAKLGEVIYFNKEVEDRD